MAELSTEQDPRMQNRRRRVREIPMVQNFTLVWLDGSIDESDEDFQHSLTQLRRIVTKIDTFINVDSCLDFIQSIDDIHVFLIISGALGQAAMPDIHHLSNIDSIYVFCGNKVKHEQWATDWSKIAGVFTKIDKLCKKLKQDTELLDRTAIPMSITSGDLSHLEPSFMYTQLIKEILLEMDYDDRAMNELTNTCRKAYKDSPEDLRIIDEFGREYHQHSPIWWYTRECFTYRMLNQALRNQDVDILIKMGFFLRDLHRQSSNSYTLTDQNIWESRSLVYRGQGLPTSHFETIKKQSQWSHIIQQFPLDKLQQRRVSKELRTQTLCVDWILSESSFGWPSIHPSSTTPFVSLKNISYHRWSRAKSFCFLCTLVFRIGDVRVNRWKDCGEFSLTLCRNVRRWETSPADRKLCEKKLLVVHHGIS